MHKKRILFFIGSLSAGGKERRLIELLTYLKNRENYDLMVILAYDIIQFDSFLKLDIPYRVIKKKWKYFPFTYIYKFYLICIKFHPDIIHTWGSKQTFYTLPSVLILKIPLVNNQITSAPPMIKKWSIKHIIDLVNFRFSNVILSNSQAGIISYKPSVEKSKVIYNGINLKRFINLPPINLIREKYKILTPYAVIMAATVSANKDYDLYYSVANIITSKRDDISFIGVGGYDRWDTRYSRILKMTSINPKMIFLGRVDDVEALINSCQIGILFSNKFVHGEGISNSILEYMALGKPVIANDAGGTNEIVQHNKNGYLIQDQKENEIAELIMDLIDDEEKSQKFGQTGKKIIEESFSLEGMGRSFEEVYSGLLRGTSIEEMIPDNYLSKHLS